MKDGGKETGIEEETERRDRGKVTEEKRQRGRDRGEKTEGKRQRREDRGEETERKDIGGEIEERHGRRDI